MPKEIECCGKPLKFIPEARKDWMSYIPHTTDCAACKTHFERKPEHKEIAYRRMEGHYECTRCGGEISTIDVAHPVWDGPFDGAGSGFCHNEQVPYCPKCEEVPSFRGMPIRVNSERPLTKSQVEAMIAQGEV